MDAKELLEGLDLRVDVLGEDWDEKHVLKLLKKKDDGYLCDLFLDQALFAGSGNIVKNEVLFNLRRHPLTKLSEVDPRDYKKLVHSIRVYCENFYEWKKRFELRKHWQVYKRWKCRGCERKLKREKMGKGQRSTFLCPHCQKKKNTKSRIELHEVLPIPSDGKREERFDH
jgi:endonuclease-8